MNQRISVIIPAWNVGKYLRRAVESVVATRYPNLEIIIVDDASTDDTWDVACRLREETPSIIRMFQRPTQEKRGAAATRNVGIERSTGEYVAFLDADDWVYPWCYEVAADILSSSPHIDAVYGDYDFQCADGHNLDIHVSSTVNDLPCNEHVTFSEFIAHGLWCTDTILLRRSVLDKTGLFDPGFPIGQDTHLWYRLVLCGTVCRGDRDRKIAVVFRHPKNRYDPGLHDCGRHNIELISVWRWAIRQGLTDRADELYGLWRRSWAENAVLMAKWHHFSTGFRLVRQSLQSLAAREWASRRAWCEVLRVAWAFMRHGAGYWVHNRFGWCRRPVKRR